MKNQKMKKIKQYQKRSVEDEKKKNLIKARKQEMEIF